MSHAYLVSRLSRPSVISMKISVAQRPAIRNPQVVYFPVYPLHFCNHSFSGCFLAVRQLVSARRNTYRLIYIPILTYHFGWMPITTRWSCAVTLWVPSARWSKFSPRTTTSWSLPFRTFSFIWSNQRFRGTGGLRCRFFTLAPIVSETPVVSFFDTVLFLATASILPIFSQRFSDALDSQPQHLFQLSHL